MRIGDPHFQDGIDDLGLVALILGFFVIMGMWKCADLIWMVL